MAKRKTKTQLQKQNDYTVLIEEISSVLESSRKISARSVNAILTAAYWSIGQRIVEYEYKGMDRSEYYGKRLLENISSDLQTKFGRGFSRQNIQLMKQFYEDYPLEKISQTLSGKSSADIDIRQALSGKSLENVNISQTPSSISGTQTRNTFAI